MGDDEQIKDLIPPVPLVINAAAAADVVAGTLLLVFSELIHNVIGVVLILLGIYLFLYARRVTAALDRTPDGRADKDRAVAGKSGPDGSGRTG